MHDLWRRHEWCDRMRLFATVVVSMSLLLVACFERAEVDRDAVLQHAEATEVFAFSPEIVQRMDKQRVDTSQVIRVIAEFVKICGDTPVDRSLDTVREGKLPHTGEATIDVVYKYRFDCGLAGMRLRYLRNAFRPQLVQMDLHIDRGATN